MTPKQHRSFAPVPDCGCPHIEVEAILAVWFGLGLPNDCPQGGHPFRWLGGSIAVLERITHPGPGLGSGRRAKALLPAGWATVGDADKLVDGVGGGSPERTGSSFNDDVHLRKCLLRWSAPECALVSSYHFSRRES